jgi:glucose-1-phosphate thymidylyltransferase
MKAIILAGGYATRLWPLTKDRAKPLLLLNGRPLISHIIENLPSDMDVFVYTNSKFKNDFDLWNKQWNTGRKVTVGCEKSRTEKQKLGALGAVAECLRRYNIDEDILVIGGDNFFGFSIAKFLKSYEGLPLLAAYNVKSFDEAKRFGVLKVKNGKVVEFHEKPEHPNSTLVNTLCTIIPENNLSDLYGFVKEHADNFGRFIEYLLTKSEVQAYVSEKNWFDIGSFDGYIEAHKKLERKGKERGHYLGTDLYGKNTLTGNVFIDRGTVIKNSQLEDCIVLSNCEIIDSNIKNCIIDENCMIKGCEIKYEMIEKGSKMNCNKGKCGIKI